MGKFLLAFLAVAFLAGPAKAQSDYEIKLFRPNKLNDQYHVSATGYQVRQVVLRSPNGDALRTNRDSFSVDMTGSVRVLEVDAKGNVLRAAVRIDSLVRAIGLRRDELLKPGTVVIERRAGARQEFEIDGRAVGPELKDALDVALSETNGSVAPSDDELMGTRERKKVGDSWPVNRERLAGFFSADSDMSLTVTPADIEGRSTLAAAARVDGVDCLRIEVAMTIRGVPREAKLPEGMDKATIEVRISSLYPVDTRLDQIEESTQLTMTLAAPAAAPREGQIITTWEQRSDRKLKPIR